MYYTQKYTNKDMIKNLTFVFRTAVNCYIYLAENYQIFKEWKFTYMNIITHHIYHKIIHTNSLYRANPM